MSKESVPVKRGDVASTMDPNLDEDHEMATLTAICIVGPKLRQNDKLVKDANAFGHKLLFSENGSDHFPLEEVAYVVEEFEGPIYDELHSKRLTILGPTLVHQLAARGLTPQPCERPLFNLSMESVGICFNHCSKKFKSDIKRYFAWIQSMGGSVLKEVNTPRVTHLVTDSCRGDKYRYASTFGLPVMSGEWIRTAWAHRNEIDFKAGNPKFVDMHKVKPFHGAQVHFLGFDTSEMSVLTSELIRNGGKLCSDYHQDNCTHIVIDDSKGLSVPNDVRKDVPVVKVEWFWASIQMDACAEEKLHLYSSDPNSYLSPGGALFSPGTPGSASRKRKRRKDAIIQLAANDPQVHLNSKNRRSSVSELAMLSMSGSFLDTPDQTPTGSQNQVPLRNKSNSNLLQVPDQAALVLNNEVERSSPLTSVSSALDLKSMSPRQRVFNELVQTETNFVTVLKSILQVFKKPLDDPNQIGGPLLNQTELKIIFGNLPPIYDVHMKMLADFTHAQANWTDSFSIGNVYLKYADDLLKAYPPYVNFYEDSKNMLIKCEKANPRFYAFLKVCQSKPESGRQHLADLLMHPIQRLPRVILLLTDILKQTNRENKDHKDIGNLDKAMTKIKKVVNHINEDKRKTEGQVQIFEIFSDIENCPPDLVSSHRVFLSKIDVVELGGSDELCGKGYELSLFLFSDVMEISKKKSAAKGLGLRSPSTMSLRNVGIAPAPGPIKDPSKDSATKYHKHVNLMNLTAIKRVVDVTETQVDAGIFALVCRTNQELKERMFVFQITSEDVDKTGFLKQLCRNIASTMCRPDPDTYLRQMRAEDLGLEPSDFNVSNFSSTYRTLQKKVNRAFSFNKTPTSNRLKRAVSSMISPLSSTNPNHRMANSTPSSDLQNLRLASCTNLMSPVLSASNSSSASSFMSPMPPPSAPPPSSFHTPKRGMAPLAMSPLDHDSSGFSIPKTPASSSNNMCVRRPSFKMKVNTLLGSGSKNK